MTNLFNKRERDARALIASACNGDELSAQMLAGYVKQAETTIINGVFPHAINNDQDHKEYASFKDIPDGPNMIATLLAMTTFTVMCGQNSVTVTPNDLLDIERFFLQSPLWQPDSKWPFTKEQMESKS